jgi:PIN domain nuclease of toxin-antitoxin system
MQVLLDTHLFIWWLKDDLQLSKKARTTITNADIVYVSSVSIWEAAIKIQLGKLDANINELVEAIETEGFTELPLLAKQVAAVTELPLIHRDPFDSMLIAQAISEPLRLLTSDEILKQYSELVDIV